MFELFPTHDTASELLWCQCEFQSQQDITQNLPMEKYFLTKYLHHFKHCSSLSHQMQVLDLPLVKFLQVEEHPQLETGIDSAIPPGFAQEMTDTVTCISILNKTEYQSSNTRPYMFPMRA